MKDHDAGRLRVLGIFELFRWANLNMCLNICLFMTSKTITIREDIYRMLLSIKGANESFSNFFERLVKSRKNIDKLKDLRGSVEFRNKEALLKEMSDKRKEIRY